MKSIWNWLLAASVALLAGSLYLRYKRPGSSADRPETASASPSDTAPEEAAVAVPREDVTLDRIVADPQTAPEQYHRQLRQALQNEVPDMIRLMIADVEDCRLVTEDDAQGSRIARVELFLAGNRQPTPNELALIREQTAASVSGVTEEKVSVCDMNGKPYASFP